MSQGAVTTQPRAAAIQRSRKAVIQRSLQQKQVSTYQALAVELDRMRETCRDNEISIVDLERGIVDLEKQKRELVMAYIAYGLYSYGLYSLWPI